MRLIVVTVALLCSSTALAGHSTFNPAIAVQGTQSKKQKPFKSRIDWEEFSKKWKLANEEERTGLLNTKSLIRSAKVGLADLMRKFQGQSLEELQAVIATNWPPL